MSEFPARTLVVALPLEIAEALAALAAEGGEAPESFAAELLGDAVRLGAPGDLHAAARLAAEVAETLAARWRERQQALTLLRAELRRIEEELGRLAQGA